MAYVYIHKRKNNNEIFYVGVSEKDDSNRAYVKAQRSKYWKDIVNKYGYEVEIVITGIPFAEALLVEKYLIMFFGRIDRNKGKLVNFTDGGEGICGHKHTPEIRKIISESGMGRKLSQETIDKIQEKRKGYKPTKETIKKGVTTRKKNGSYKMSEENKKKISEVNKGKSISQEMKNRISKTLMGKKHSDERKANIKLGIKNGKKRIISEESRKATSERFRNTIRTQEWKDNISKGLKGKKRTPEQIEVMRELSKNPIAKIDLNNNILQTYNSIKDAHKKEHISRSTISNFIKTKTFHKNGFSFIKL